MKTITIDGIEYQLTPVVTEPTQPAKWIPKSVGLNKPYKYLNSDGEILDVENRKSAVDDLRLQLGNYFHSKEEALEAAAQLRKLLRLRAYVREFAPGYAPDWKSHNETKFHVYFDGKRQKWLRGYTNETANPTTVYMPEEVAEILVIKLNSGEVVL